MPRLSASSTQSTCRDEISMNEQDVRALVREAIERHLGRPRASGATDRLRQGYGESSHPSHTLLAVLPGSRVDDGMCVIEPAVRCNHADSANPMVTSHGEALDSGYLQAAFIGN